MSSTNRGRARNALDQYETPWEAVAPLLPHLPAVESVLDPCCGTGAMVALVGQALRVQRLEGIEIDEGRTKLSLVPRVQVADALSVAWPQVGLVITNPPFALAREFVEKARGHARAGATVAMLLRLAFLASQGRATLHAQYPADVLVLAKRPSFLAGGGSDSADYAWMMWGPGRGGRWQVLRPIETDAGARTLPLSL